MSGKLDHVNLRRLSSLDDANDFMRWLGESRQILGVDTESGGFFPEHNRLRMVQFGDLKTGWAIPWERWSGIILEALRRYREPLVLHNSKFDARFITKNSNFKWPWHLTNDTMTMAHLADPLRPKGLKPLGAIHVDPKAAQAQRLLDQAMSDNKWTWDTVPDDFPLYWIYSAMDPVLTCYIYEKLAPTTLSSYKEVYDLEMGVTRIIAGMEARGVKIDPGYCATKRAELIEFAQKSRIWLNEEFGIANIGSTMQLLKFFDANRVPLLPKKTASGKQSMDKEVLEAIDHDVARYVLGIRKAEKIVGTYLDNFLELRDENNYIHPNIWTMGTRTARMSVTDPGLQTLHRKDPTVRTAIIPSPGRSLITCDYDQIEARLAAHFSGDKGLIAAFGKEEDFFCTIAAEIFSETIAKKDPRRQLTKNTMYGKIYAAGVEKMALTAGVPFEVMAPVVAHFDALYPGLKAWQREVGQQARSSKFRDGVASIVTPYGRRLVADDGKDYTLLNYLIQSHAAEILKRKIVELDTVLDQEAGNDAEMVLPVHDEVVFDVNAEIAPHIRTVIEKTMADDSYLVPITASSDLLLNNWGDKYR